MEFVSGVSECFFCLIKYKKKQILVILDGWCFLTKKRGEV